MAKYKKLLSVITCDDFNKTFKVFKILDKELTKEGYKLEKNKLYFRVKGKGAELYFVSHDNLEEFKEKVNDHIIINGVLEDKK